MKGFLRIAIACYDVLLDVDGVQEVLELEDNAATHRDWRDRLLACIDAYALMGLVSDDPGAEVAQRQADGVTRRVGVVYQAADEAALPVILAVDRIVRLLYLDETDFLPLPAVPLRVLALFDAIYPDPVSGVQVYRLRRPLDALA